MNIDELNYPKTSEGEALRSLLNTLAPSGDVTEAVEALQQILESIFAHSQECRDE